MEFTTALKKNYEFRRLYAKGKSAATGNIVVYCRKSSQPGNRLGLTVGTKVGKAVIRNRVRRRLREIYRINEHRLADGYDVVIVGRVRSREAKYGVLESDFLSLCGRLGILNE
jgi:ribonuclease P protein component